MKYELNERIDILDALGSRLLDESDPFVRKMVDRAFVKNPWFTPSNTRKSLKAIADSYLDGDKLKQWAARYSIRKQHGKTIALVLAGNIPAVGFHDVLCSFLSGHKTMIKCSSKDDVLIPRMVKLMEEIRPGVGARFIWADKLQDFDAIIATGGDSAALHFNYYFSSYPHVIRKNRTSVAVLDGDESDDQLALLGRDVFEYFGMGCRSVAKLYLPRDYDLNRIFGSILEFASIIDHNKYKNNYDYNSAIYSMGNRPFLTNGFVIFREDASLSSRIASVHYEYYDDLDQVMDSLKVHSEAIQCISSEIELPGFETVGLGACQRPALSDYADGVDTMAFLTNLS